MLTLLISSLLATVSLLKSSKAEELMSDIDLNTPSSEGCQFSQNQKVTKLPGPPLLSSHPGSLNYTHQFQVKKRKGLGRPFLLFLPTQSQLGESFPFIAFGHGQALTVKNYRSTFEHLAKKGIASALIPYDRGFFDRDFERMGRDFTSIVKEILTNEPFINPKIIIYSGHSKGAFVALNAAAISKKGGVGAVVVFAPAGYSPSLIKKMDPHLPVTLAIGESDHVIKESMSAEIFRELPSLNKQRILVRNYTTTCPKLKAGHFFPLSAGFGAKLGPFLYYSVWKWLMGAVSDLQEGGFLIHADIYGEKSLDKGIEGFADKRVSSTSFDLNQRR